MFFFYSKIQSRILLSFNHHVSLASPICDSFCLHLFFMVLTNIRWIGRYFVEGHPQFGFVWGFEIRRGLQQRWGGLPRWHSGKESASQCRCGFDPKVRKIPCRREWQLTPVFFSGKSHGQRKLVGYSPWGSQRVVYDWATEHTQHSGSNTILL